MILHSDMSGNQLLQALAYYFSEHEKLVAENDALRFLQLAIVRPVQQDPAYADAIADLRADSRAMIKHQLTGSKEGMTALQHLVDTADVVVSLALARPVQPKEAK